MSKKYDVVAVTGTFTTKEGEEKKRYKNVGFINENEKGNLSLKLDHPVTVDDEGKVVNWFGLFEPRDKPQSRASQPPDMEDEDIPF